MKSRQRALSRTESPERVAWSGEQHHTVPSSLPVNGGYTEWNQWAVCSASCGGGNQQRKRTCRSPEPQNGGKDCSALGGDMETRGCNSEACPGVKGNEMKDSRRVCVCAQACWSGRCSPKLDCELRPRGFAVFALDLGLTKPWETRQNGAFHRTFDGLG